MKFETPFKYHQPDFYRFNSDSILLADYASQFLSPDSEIVDLCAGCGVVGIEASLRLPVRRVTFIELQESFISSLETNVSMWREHGGYGEVINENMMDHQRKYDFALMNPPYFDPEKSRVPQDRNRAIARHTLDYSLADFVKKGRELVRPKGHLFFVSPSGLKEEGVEEQESFSSGISIYRSLSLN